MVYSIFFDQFDNFQWASIAAITSSLALLTSVVSLAIKLREGKKNRKSTTIVNSRMQELKEVREEVESLTFAMDTFLKARDLKHKPTNTTISKKEPKIRKLDAHFNKLSAQLYRETSHVDKLSITLSTNRIMLVDLNHTDQLQGMLITLKNAIKEYTRTENKEIEKLL